MRSKAMGKAGTVERQTEEKHTDKEMQTSQSPGKRQRLTLNQKRQLSGQEKVIDKS